MRIADLRPFPSQILILPISSKPVPSANIDLVRLRPRHQTWVKFSPSRTTVQKLTSQSHISQYCLHLLVDVVARLEFVPELAFLITSMSFLVRFLLYRPRPTAVPQQFVEII